MESNICVAPEPPRCFGFRQVNEITFALFFSLRLEGNYSSCRSRIKCASGSWSRSEYYGSLLCQSNFPEHSCLTGDSIKAAPLCAFYQQRVRTALQVREKGAFDFAAVAARVAEGAKAESWMKTTKDDCCELFKAEPWTLPQKKRGCWRYSDLFKWVNPVVCFFRSCRRAKWQTVLVHRADINITCLLIMVFWRGFKMLLSVFLTPGAARGCFQGREWSCSAGSCTECALVVRGRLILTKKCVIPTFYM